MIWLYLTILAILAILALIILSPLRLIIKYKGSLKIKLKILCFSFNIYSETSSKKEKSSKIQNKREDKKKDGFVSNLIKEKGVIGSLKLFSKILKLSEDMLKKVSKGVSVNKMKVHLIIGATDAASAAIKYGQASAILYPTAAFITSWIQPKEYSVNITSDFLIEKISMDLELDISARVFYILYMLLIFSEKYSKLVN